jgi:integration host factor subunit beta
MTKKEIVKSISERVVVPTATVQEAVQMVFDGIIETLVQEGGIELRNFGIFQVRERKARKGRNPRSGEMVAVPSKHVVVFKPGLEMLERVRSMKDAAVGVEATTDGEMTSDGKNLSPPA